MCVKFFSLKEAVILFAAEMWRQTSSLGFACVSVRLQREDLLFT